MVGTVLAIMRGVAPEECIQLALDPDKDIHTPMAPELGLFLVRFQSSIYHDHTFLGAVPQGPPRAGSATLVLLRPARGGLSRLC